MEKIKLYALTFATIAMSLVSCVKKEDPIKTPDEIFHVVHFETESSQTKTTMKIDGSTVNFAWEETDYDVKLQRFHVWENENPAVRIEPDYNETTKKLSLDATFTESLPEDPKYVGYFNGKVPALQVPRNNQYDADADVLIAESRKEEDQFVFYFQRVVAIGKLTLKGIDEGETLQSVTFELAESSDQFLTASLDRSKESSDGWAWAETGKKITLNCNHTIDAEASPALYFTCVPVNEGMFTVKAVTDKNTYSKTFAKAISLTRGNVKGMSVTMEKDEKAETTFVIDINTFKESGNTALTTGYSNNNFSTSGYTFSTQRIMTNLANFNTSNIKAGTIIQMAKNTQATQVGFIKSTSEIALKSIKVYYYSTAYHIVSAGIVSNSLSAVSGSTAVDEFDFPKNDSSKAAAKCKSQTYNVEGKKYFKIESNTSGTSYIYKIEVTYGESTPTGVKLAAPANLAVNADKQIVWDRVENAGSYNVYINGGAAIPVTDHYYDASSQADGYYNVAVEAVPANSEMFTKSDKATLTNAKFGTPTLATPAPEVAKTDKTITLTWDVDAHANGYTYTLYKGEDVVESPTANYRVAEGVATLVYSNLSPKTAYSVKVNATLVESPLRYEASEVYTTDVITTLSTINYAELQNGTYSIENPRFIAVGEEVMFTATPSTGYEFEGVSVTGIEAANIERADEIFTFTMPDLAEVTVAVTFAPIGFTLGTSLLDSENDHGTVVIDSPKERYTVTDVIALTVTPEDHYEVVEVEAVEDEGSNSIEATLNGETGKYEITGLHFNAELMASFKLIDYPITVADGIKNGTVTRGSETATYNQENVSFTVKPSAGYQIAIVTVSGASGEVTATAGATDEQGTHYTFTMPGENVTITATFDAIDYTVTGVAVSQTCHGSVTADKATANIGETVTLTVTPEEDWYQLKTGTLKVNNGEVSLNQGGAPNQYTFTMPASDATVTAEFELVPYEVKDQTLSGTSLSATHGQLNFSVESGPAASTVSATFGQTVTVVPSPVEGYELSTLKLYEKGTRWSESNKVEYDPSTLTFSQPAYAVSAKAEFALKTFHFSDNGSEKTYSITNNETSADLSAGATMGTVVKLEANGIAPGKQAKWTVTPSSIALSPVVGNANAVTFTMPASDVTIKCEEGEASTTVSMTSFSAISGNVNGDVNVSYEAAKGDSSTEPAVNSNEVRVYQNGGLFTVSAATGYKLKSVTIGSSMATSVNYKLDGGVEVLSNNASISANGTYTASNLNNTSIQFICKGTDKNSRLYVNNLSVTYVADGGSGTTPLATPTGLSSGTPTATSTTLSWTAVANAGSYKVEYKVSSASLWTVKNVNTTSCELIGLTASTTYAWQVTAVPSNTTLYSNSSAAKGTNFTTTAGGGQTTVTQTSFTAISGNLNGDANISYEATKGSGTTTPAINSSKIRLYKPASGKSTGGVLTITAKNSKKIQSVVIISNRNNSFNIAADGTSKTPTITGGSPYTYSLTGLSATTVTFTNKYNDSNDISSIKVIYQ